MNNDVQVAETFQKSIKDLKKKYPNVKVLFENSLAYLLGRMGTLGIFELILIDCKI